MNFIERLAEGPVKNWFIYNNPNLDRLNQVAAQAERRKYQLDPRSGLFLRSHYSEDITQRLNSTHLDIIFLRPADYHVHNSMGEVIRILGGRGVLISGNEPYPQIVLSSGDKPFFIEEKTPHAFSPMPKDPYLEIEVVCTRIYDNNQELTLKRFDQFEPWKKLFVK
jgi:hypothetical protein